jgi:hypothetical protein
MKFLLPAIFFIAQAFAFNGKATFYTNPDFHPGSCGFGFSDQDFIAAVSGDLIHGYQDPHYCNQCALVTYKGKSVKVRLVDTCPTCEKTSLDLSPIAFQKLENLVVGILSISWELVDCNNAQVRQASSFSSFYSFQQQQQQQCIQLLCNKSEIDFRKQTFSN